MKYRPITIAKIESGIVIDHIPAGKALLISENSATNYPRPQVYAMKSMAMESDSMPRETLAIGEIEITANVQIAFILE